MSMPALLYVKLRRIPQEAFASLLAARRLGYRVILITDQDDASYDRLIERRETLSFADSEQVRSKARELASVFPIRGVVMTTESSIGLTAHIAHDLGLPHFPLDAVPRALNKAAMKEALSAHDGIAPRYCRIHSLSQLRQAISDVGYPAIVKPASASGSQGIFELRCSSDLEPAYSQLQICTDEMIVEEFLEGPEVSVEGVVSGGEISLVGITNKWTTDPFHLEYQHIFPARLATSEREEVSQKTRLIIRALGFDNCAFHLEGKLTSRGFRFIETAARPAGDYIALHLIQKTTGIDIFSELVRIAVGEHVVLKPRYHGVAGVRFLLAHEAGRLTEYGHWSQVLQWPNVQHLMIEQPLGTMIELPPVNYRQQRVMACVAADYEYGAVEETLNAVAMHCVPITTRGSA